MSISIDIIIPSFRLNPQILLKILDLHIPPDSEVQFIIIADNPDVSVPIEIIELSKIKAINILINQMNLGFSATRNRGINESKSDWIIFLDDDIDPDPNLIYAYINAIKKHKDAIGFIGTTYMPQPFNAVTTALDIYGITSHFTSALREKEMVWAPTANIMLNRKKLADRRFNEKLKNGGEDIELLSRNAIENKHKYIAVPDAKVIHPWWNDGKSQLKRMFKYGKGFADILSYPHIKKYSYYDFTNTIESLLVSIILIITLNFIKAGSIKEFILLAGLIVLSEMIICFIKTITIIKTISISVPLQLFFHKISYETGVLFQLIINGNISSFARRVDMSFRKPNPSYFRLNRWKIIKMLLIIFGLLIAYLIL